MKKIIVLCLLTCISAIFAGCGAATSPTASRPDTSTVHPLASDSYPRIANWLDAKDETITGGKPYDLVMSGWFSPEKAAALRNNNPGVLLLAGLSINFVRDNTEWQSLLTGIASYGRPEPLSITDDMYLKKPDGSRCAFNRASGGRQSEAVYAMDPRNTGWIELITSFYNNLLAQPQHDGIFIDMVMKTSCCPESISDKGWVEATRSIMIKIQQSNFEDKLVIFNTSRDFSEIEPYRDLIDGYLIENFMGTTSGIGFEEGLEAAQSSNCIVIYAVDVDDTGQQDLSKMRLGLVLSLLSDRSFFTYDFSSREHGQAWWFKEYDAILGKPLGKYYRVGDSYYRDFENGVVVASPNQSTLVTFSREYTDITSGATVASFRLNSGDARIFIKTK